MRMAPWLLLLSIAALIIIVRLTLLPAPPPALLEVETNQRSNKLAHSGRLNINDATSEELALLPHIGPKRAAAIIRERAQNGCFTTLEDLARVRGIGTKSIENLANYLEASGCAD